MTRWEFSIPEMTPGLNAMLRTHWVIRANEKERWYWLLLTASRNVPKASKPRNVTVTRYTPHKFLDRVNLWGGVKEVVEDNLRPAKVTSGVHKTGKKKGQPWTRSQIGLGLIVDDSDQWCVLQVLQEKGPEGTKVVIEEQD